MKINRILSLAMLILLAAAIGLIPVSSLKRWENLPLLSPEARANWGREIFSWRWLWI